MIDLFWFLVFWSENHPGVIVGLLVAFLVVTWFLNRKSEAAREADRVVKDLVEGAKDKYKDTRPLR